jgi:hypothetical protein
MAAYRCYFLDGAGHIRAVEIITADDLVAAIAAAVAMHEARPHHHAIELWQNGTRVYTSDDPR